MLILEEGNVSIKQFDDSEHPYHLPDKVDVFSWSMPFLVEKAVQMMKSVYTKWQDDEPLDEEGFKNATESKNILKIIKNIIEKERAAAIKGKIKAFARVQKMFSTLK